VPAPPPSALLSVRLTPRAARERLAPGADGGLVDGAANDALCRLVAKAAGVPPSRVSLARGQRARQKVVRVEGVDEATVRARIGASFPRSGR
jgi:uncharacterized protein YggU (UPF0235/DUF167 family)